MDPTNAPIVPCDGQSIVCLESSDWVKTGRLKKKHKRPFSCPSLFPCMVHSYGLHVGRRHISHPVILGHETFARERCVGVDPPWKETHHPTRPKVLLDRDVRRAGGAVRIPFPSRRRLRPLVLRSLPFRPFQKKGWRKSRRDRRRPRHPVQVQQRSVRVYDGEGLFGAPVAGPDPLRQSARVVEKAVVGEDGVWHIVPIQQSDVAPLPTHHAARRSASALPDGERF